MVSILSAVIVLMVQASAARLILGFGKGLNQSSVKPVLLRNGKHNRMSHDPSRLPAAQIVAFVARAFAAAGISTADAETLAELMVAADLRGSDTHGVIRLPLYLRRLRAGGINPSRTSASCASSRRPRCSTATTAWAIW
jgi:hypothetical protein